MAGFLDKRGTGDVSRASKNLLKCLWNQTGNWVICKAFFSGGWAFQLRDSGSHAYCVCQEAGISWGLIEHLLGPVLFMISISCLGRLPSALCQDSKGKDKLMTTHFQIPLWSRIGENKFIYLFLQNICYLLQATFSCWQCSRYSLRKSAPWVWKIN